MALTPIQELYISLEDKSEQSEAGIESIDEQIALKKVDRDALLDILYDTSANVVSILTPKGDYVHTFGSFFNGPPPGFDLDNPGDLTPWYFLNLEEWHVLDTIGNATTGLPPGYGGQEPPLPCDSTGGVDGAFYLSGDQTSLFDGNMFAVKIGSDFFYTVETCSSYYSTDNVTVVIADVDSTSNIHMSEAYHTASSWPGDDESIEIIKPVLIKDGIGWGGEDATSIESFIVEFVFTNDMLYHPMSGDWTNDGVSDGPGEPLGIATYGILDMIKQLLNGRSLLVRDKAKYDEGIVALERFK